LIINFLKRKKRRKKGNQRRAQPPLHSCFIFAFDFGDFLFIYASLFKAIKTNKKLL